MRHLPSGTTTVRERTPNASSATGPGAPVPPTLIFVAGLGGGWWLDGAGASAEGVVPVPLLVSGWTLCALGIALFVWGLATFASAGTGIMLQQGATEVVARGPYRWSRNPQYVAFILIYSGISLITGLMWALLLLPVAVAAVSRLVIGREERYMRGTFGHVYGRYCERVPRWL
jgi:protein-S-isoprenylcysteine O-methyltransferase Ste14